MKGRWYQALVALVLAAALLPAAVVPVSAQEAEELPPEGSFRPGEVVVMFGEGVAVTETPARAAALAGEVQAAVERVEGSMALLRVDPAADVLALSAMLAEQADVAYAGPNFIVSAALDDRVLELEPNPEREFISQTPVIMGEAGQEPRYGTADLTREELSSLKRLKRTSSGTVTSAALVPNDYYNNWGYDTMGGLTVLGNTTASPTICILSTGADTTHPDLLYRVTNGYDFVNVDSLAADDNGLGTHLAGIIAAKSNNGNGTTIGISSGKALAVKVLDAAGQGGEFELAQGINYCANNTGIKIILISGTGYMWQAGPVYTALTNAIITKGKLVVAAAGDRGTSNILYSYPAYWTVSTPFAGGMLSVGATISGKRWVDWNEDGIRISDEEYTNCATDTSNYGAWVEMVAPGSSIYSTLPVKNPYYIAYMAGYPLGSVPKYGNLSGTPQAAAAAAAAVARLWGTAPVQDNIDLVLSAMNRGTAVNTVVDEHTANAVYAWKYGGYTGNAPFCWPNAQLPFGSSQNMSASRFPNVGSYLERGALEAGVWDALTGLPAVGARVQAVEKNTGIVRDTGVVTTASPLVILSNLPLSAGGYNLQVSLTGKTSGYQKYRPSAVGVNAGHVSRYGFSYLSLAPSNNYQVIADWHDDTAYDQNQMDLDLYLWLPSNAQYPGVGPQWVLGSGYSGKGFSYEIGPGALASFPFARYWRDGAAYFSEVVKEENSDWVGSEVITIARKPGGNYPYFYDLPVGSPEWRNRYNILMRDFSDDTASNFTVTDEILRIWLGGVIKAIWTSGSCGVTENWWYGGSIYRDLTGTVNPRDANGVVYKQENICGTNADWDGTPTSVGVWPW